MQSRDHVISNFLDVAGWANATRLRIAGDASNRRYDRLSLPGKQDLILMDAPPDKGEDVRPFIQIASFLRGAGLSAPQILHADATQGLLLIEDFGDALFADLIAEDPAREIPLYQSAADVLIHLHQTTPPDVPHCDADWLTSMIDPLFEWYAPEVEPSAVQAFIAAFEPLAQATTAMPQVLILRDYHAQNLLLLPERQGVGKVGLLDFQDALLGHPAYDLVSILQDARRDVSAEVEAQIVAYMLAQTGTDPQEFHAAYAFLGLQRNLRILGIFARLCLRDGKPAYVDMIPRVWTYVTRNLAHPALADLGKTLLPVLPTPTPEFLSELKRRCPNFPS